MCVHWHTLVTSRLRLIIVLALVCLLIRMFGACCFLEVNLLIRLGIGAGRPLKLFDVGFAVLRVGCQCSDTFCRFVRNSTEFELYQEFWSLNFNENLIKMNEKERGILYIWSATGWKTDEFGFHFRYGSDNVAYRPVAKRWLYKQRRLLGKPLNIHERKVELCYNREVWRRQKGKSRIWDSKIWSRVPRDTDPRMNALARASSNCKWQNHPLVREDDI
jgi:hypothetical protein